MRILTPISHFYVYIYYWVFVCQHHRFYLTKFLNIFYFHNQNNKASIFKYEFRNKSIEKLNRNQSMDYYKFNIYQLEITLLDRSLKEE